MGGYAASATGSGACHAGSAVVRQLHSRWSTASACRRSRVRGCSAPQAVFTGSAARWWPRSVLKLTRNAIVAVVLPRLRWMSAEVDDSYGFRQVSALGRTTLGGVGTVGELRLEVREFGGQVGADRAGRQAAGRSRSAAGHGMLAVRGVEPSPGLSRVPGRRAEAVEGRSLTHPGPGPRGPPSVSGAGRTWRYRAQTGCRQGAAEVRWCVPGTGTRWAC